VKINVAEPTGAGGSASRPSGPAPVPAHQHAAVPPPPADLPALGRIVAVSSGKGGVGKSTVSANLAVELGQTGCEGRVDGCRHLWSQHSPHVRAV